MNDSIVMLYRNGVFFKSFLLFTKIVLPLQPHFAKTYIWAAARFRKIGRVIECAGLEIRYTPFGYRGFESLIFRKIERASSSRVATSFAERWQQKRRGNPSSSAKEKRSRYGFSFSFLIYLIKSILRLRNLSRAAPLSIPFWSRARSMS